MFRIDFKRLAVLLLPISLRSPLVFGLLRAGMIGLEHVYREFHAARHDHNFRLTHSGQVCYIRGMLHYYFGPGFKIDKIGQEGKWLYAIDEAGKQIPLAVSERLPGVPVLSSEQILNATQNDFVVCVPAAYWSRKGEIEAMVNKYKLITKRALYMKIDDPLLSHSGPQATWGPDVFNHLIPNK